MVFPGGKFLSEEGLLGPPSLGSEPPGTPDRALVILGLSREDQNILMMTSAIL